jgi:hypothetical protein
MSIGDVFQAVVVVAMDRRNDPRHKKSKANNHGKHDLRKGD